MSGLAEASAILGVISACITVFEKAKQGYDAAHNAKGLPEAFRKVSENIPLVLSILSSIYAILEARKNAIKHPGDVAHEQAFKDAVEVVQPVIDKCQENAESLKHIFDKVLPDDDASWLKRYRLALHTLKLGRKQKVEDLMKEILEKLSLLQTDHYFGTAIQSDNLQTAIQQLKKVSSSLPDDEGNSGGTFNNSGSGPQNVSTGKSSQTNNTQSGGSGNTQNNAPSTHHHGRQ